MAPRPSATPNTNRRRRLETPIPMARFSICEDDEDAPVTVKRPRVNQPASQSQQRSSQRSQSQARALVEEEVQPIPVEDEESDSQDYEEEEDDDDDDDDDDDESEDEEDDEDDDEDEEVEEAGEDVSAAHGEAAAEPVSVGQIQQQQISFVNVPSSTTASPEHNHSSGPIDVVLVDTEALDCPICLDPLSAPIYQCENGHIACFSCCLKMKMKCASCCMPTGYNRCRAVEKLLEVIVLKCKYARYGCVELTPYAKKSEHEQMCPHALCFCPHPSCDFVGSSKNLYLHFGMHHAASATRFKYNDPFDVDLARNRRYLFLQEQNESVIFILNHQVKEYGRVISVDCVGPRTSTNEFTYHLIAVAMEGMGVLRLDCVPEMKLRWRENTTMLNKNYLLVPSDFSGSSEVLSLQVRIKKDI